ncbi:transcriptional regulator [Bacterioplanes sanyensis]|uniref:LysR family transcriptional regulator n=1 Tax=Bacterioplanes sanyensis TaxID=1249553 RepID=UPI001679AAB2|nr:LysR family transcriptional regulator [Bacterioplanes sanyensis]GGY49373.1 transcriptional regulator [Bacterioplanes sanyensis]
MLENIRWDDIRIALAVAQLGSLSRAGELLGMNHSTVLRHVNQLEASLNQKLFIRHQRGYRLTDAGRYLLEHGQPLAASMQRLHSNLAALDASPGGTLRISTATDFSQFFAPLLRDFRHQHPQIRVQVLATDEHVSLTSGDVHVAIRMGPQPQQSDLIARPLARVSIHFYAAASYVRHYGLPTTLEQAAEHLWVLPTGNKRRIAEIRAVLQQVPEHRIALSSNSFNDIYYAVREGMGIGGFGSLQHQQAQHDGLTPVPLDVPCEPEPMWFVYHRELKNSARVKALLEFLQSQLAASPLPDD